MELENKILSLISQELLNFEYFLVFNQETEMEQYLKLNKFLDIRRISISYVRLVIYFYKVGNNFH